jgi:foldase protein PrsA
MTGRNAGLALGSMLISVLPLAAAKTEPDRVVVQHILIGFKKSIAGKTLERSKAEARGLAEELLRRAQKGEDFDALVKEYTNDKYPGKYLLTNKDAPRVSGGMTRQEMVARFGDVAFRLEVGEVGLAEYHAVFSPYGWHVIKRLE